MCCSVCRNDFGEDAATVLRNEGDLLVLRIKCTKCGKNFGIALLGAGLDNAKDDEPFVFQQRPEPVNYDDVIDAHNFIKQLDGGWMKYIPDNLKH